MKHDDPSATHPPDSEAEPNVGGDPRGGVKARGLGSEGVVKEEVLARLLDEAAEKGARRALKAVGLHDEEAGRDIHELRDLLDAWREVRRTVRTALIRAFAMALLGGLAAWAGIKWKWFGE